MPTRKPRSARPFPTCCDPSASCDVAHIDATCAPPVPDACPDCGMTADDHEGRRLGYPWCMVRAVFASRFERLTSRGTWAYRYDRIVRDGEVKFESRFWRDACHDAHPLPGGAYVVLAAEMHWVVGMLYWAVLLRAEDGTQVVAEQPTACYSDAPARLHTADGTYRQAADRVSTTIGEVAAVRFVMDWSTASSVHPTPVAATFAAASG